MRLEILLTAILFFGGAFFAGYGLRRVLKLHKEGFWFSIVAGVMVWWALMELILVPMTMKLASFHSFVMVYTIAAYHDLGLCEGREFHHLISGKILG